jgi:polyferredoxin
VALTRTFIPLTPVPVSSPTGPRALSATAGSRTGTTPGMRAGPLKVRKPFTRRRAGHEQLIRQSAQLAFLLLNLWIGARFYLFVRYYELGGGTLFVDRPPGVEGWLPIAALMNLKYFVLTGAMPTVHPAGMFLLVAFLSISLLFRKAFCSWLCPVGTISEWLWKGGEAMFGRSLRVWRPLDVVLRGLKYILLGLFLFAVGSMSSVDIAAFLESPYGLVADVKMLDFFRRMGTTAAVVIGVLLLVSVVVKNAWCRYLCPYGALMGLVALVSPTRIRRNPDLCIDCAKCAKACPAALPVDRLASVRSAECSACMLCVTECPAVGALDLSVSKRPVLPAWALATGAVAIFLALVGVARATGHWHTPVTDAQYRDLIPRAAQFAHPR